MPGKAEPKLDLAAVFSGDRARRPAYRQLLAEAWSLLTYYPPSPSTGELPDGGGRAVLVVPAFLTGDSVTRSLRNYLGQCGFRPFGWGLGVNWGPTPRLLSGLERRVSDLRRENGPVALIGISLGGLLARNLAYERPDDIRHVVTIASPFRLPTASTLEPLVRICAGHYSPSVDTARLRSPLPVPSTMIWTHDDGIVAPESCRADDGNSETVELSGAHLTLGRSPQALRTIVRRLADV